MPTRENASGSQGTDTSSLSRPIWQVSGVLCSETKHGRDLGTRAEPFSFWKVGHQNFVGKLGGTRGLGGWILPLKRQSNICEKVSDLYRSTATTTRTPAVKTKFGLIQYSYKRQSL